MSIIIQNLAQLKALFEKQWESIVGNCQAMAFTSPAGLTTFPVCPACMATLEREGQNFCDHCGQRLDWRWYKHAQIIYPGQKSALNILDKDDVLIST